MIKDLDIITYAKDFENDFRRILSVNSDYQPKGIFNSEMLMFLSIVDRFCIGHIIESGRARGHSTEIIARHIDGKAIRFDSIEFDQTSLDARSAENRIGALGIPVNLHYADAFDAIPGLIRENESLKAILIDGPKGFKALKLGFEALREPKVRFVFFHDVHRDADDVRPILDRIFGPWVHYSDNFNYVEAFRHLDDICWQIQRHNDVIDFAREWRPYRRGQRKMKSYASTLGVIDNDGIPREVIDSALNRVEAGLARQRGLKHLLRWKIKSILNL